MADNQGRSSSSLKRLLVLLIVIGTLAAGVYGSTRLFARIDDDVTSSAMTHRASKSELLITVTEDGNLQSAANIDIKCQVAGGSSILWIVKDGTEVEKGDKLVDLNSAQLDDQINQQRIIVERARSTMVQAEKDSSVAQISVTEYVEGTYLKDMQTMDGQITIALENLRSAENVLAFSQNMFRKGYISSLELESQQFAVQRANLDLAAARMAKTVTEKFTKAKTLEDLQSKVATAAAKLNSEKAAFALEESKLNQLLNEQKLCSITAPQSGMVVYANDQADRRFGGGGGGGGPGQASVIEEGSAVRPRQTILRLPDLSKMEVKVNVHETKVESLKHDMPARIRIQDKELMGTVTSIGTQPEPTSQFMGNVKEYATLVKIDGAPEGLRPGMTAEVEILVARRENVISIPVVAVVEMRNKYFCWVKAKGKFEKRPVELGLTNDQFVEVKDGLVEGDEVLLNPRAIVEEARQSALNVEIEDSSKKFDGMVVPAGDAGKSGRRGGDGAPDSGAGREGRGKGRGGFNVMSNDQNGDGKVSREEAAAMPPEVFDRIDTNKDGFVDRAEGAAAAQRRGGGKRGNRGDTEGGGPTPD